MPMGYRGIDPEKAAYVELTGFKALSDEEAADIISNLTSMYDEGRFTPGHLVTEIFRVICLSRTYGKPFPLSLEDFARHQAETFVEVTRKPVPAHLWSEG